MQGPTLLEQDSPHSQCHTGTKTISSHSWPSMNVQVMPLSTQQRPKGKAWWKFETRLKFTLQAGQKKGFNFHIHIPEGEISTLHINAAVC